MNYWIAEIQIRRILCTWMNEELKGKGYLISFYLKEYKIKKKRRNLTITFFLSLFLQEPTQVPLYSFFSNVSLWNIWLHAAYAKNLRNSSQTKHLCSTIRCTFCCFLFILYLFIYNSTRFFVVFRFILLKCLNLN